MAISFNKDRTAVKGFTEGPVWIGELNTSHAVTSWILLDRTGELTITPNENEQKYTDNSGKTYRRHGVLNDYTIEMKILATDEKVRQLFAGVGDQTLAGRTFALCFLDSKFGTKQGYWVFYEVEFHRSSGALALGSADKGYMLTCTAYANTTCADVTITLPSGETCFTPTATGATIANGEWFYTADGTV